MTTNHLLGLGLCTLQRFAHTLLLVSPLCLQLLLSLPEPTLLVLGL
jgi:hypothetical protein